MAGAALFPALLVLTWPIFLSFPTDQINLFLFQVTYCSVETSQTGNESLLMTLWFKLSGFNPRCLDPTGPRVKINLFFSSEILKCRLFVSSCLLYLNCFFFMWNSCDTFRLDGNHRMQPETNQNRKWESCLSEWLEPTGPPRASVWRGTNVWKSVSVLWVTWTSTLRNTISRRRAKTDVIILTTSETYSRFNVMPLWR